MSNRKLELKKHYLDTTYSVFIEDKKHDIKIGKQLPTVIQELINVERSALILTAWNPRSQTLSLTENKSRNSVLSTKLNKYTVFKAIGQGSNTSWPAEKSYFVLGISSDEAVKLAVEFEQYAYVWFEKGEQASLIFSELW